MTPHAMSPVARRRPSPAHLLVLLVITALGAAGLAAGLTGAATADTTTTLVQRAKIPLQN